MTESQLVETITTFHRLIHQGFIRGNLVELSDFEAAELRVVLNPTELANLWQQTTGDNSAKAAALVQHLDFYLNAGQLYLEHQSGGQSYQAIVDVALASNNLEQRLKWVTYGVVNAPVSTVQR